MKISWDKTLFATGWQHGILPDLTAEISNICDLPLFNKTLKYYSLDYIFKL